MKKKKPEILELTVEQLGVEWAVNALAYSGPMLVLLLLAFVVFVITVAIGFIGFISIDAMLFIAIAIFTGIAVSIGFLALPGIKLAAKAGPKYMAMRDYYGKNQKACIAEALKDSRVIKSQKRMGKAMSNITLKMISSKLMKY
jgi:hypothetical protein